MAFLYDLPTVMPFCALASFAIAAAFAGLTAVSEPASFGADPEALADIPQPVACVVGPERLFPAKATATRNSAASRAPLIVFLLGARNEPSLFSPLDLALTVTPSATVV
jgi:hypothetical protein